MSNNALTVKEAADLCMVSPETVRRWIRRKELRAFNTRGKGFIKIRTDDLRAFVLESNILTAEDLDGGKLGSGAI